MKQSQIDFVLNKNAVFLKTMFFACVNHETLTVDHRRKCEMKFLHKRSKMTKQRQAHVDHMQWYNFTNITRVIDYDNRSQMKKVEVINLKKIHNLSCFFL